MRSTLSIACPPASGIHLARARWALHLCLVLLVWTTAVGQTPLARVASAAGLQTNPAKTNLAAGANGSDSTANTLVTRLAEARAQLALFGDSGWTNAPAGVSPQDLWLRRALCYRLVGLYEQQLSNAEAREKVRARKAELAREAQVWTHFAESPPYSVLFTDRLREEVQAEKQKLRNGEAAAPVLNRLIEENRGLVTQAEEKIRQLNEQLETANDPAVTARLSWERELQRLRSQVAVGTLGVLESEQLLGQETLAESHIRLELLQRQLAIADSGATFTQADLDRVTARIEHQREQLDRELAEAQTRRIAAAQGLDAAREDLRQRATARSTELVSARETQLETADTAIRVLRLMLEGTNLERAMWELRFATHDSRSVEKLTDSARRLDASARRLELWLEPVRQQLDVSSSQIQLQAARVADLPADSELRPLADARLGSLREHDQLLQRTARAIESLRRLTQRWAEELQAAESKLPLAGRVRNLFSDAGSFLQRLWSFEVFTAEDTITVDGQKLTGKRSVTIGKVVMAVLILVVGYWVSGLITALVEPLIVKRLKIEPNQANLIRRWLRALLVACLLLFSLVSVKIPLTVFAFAGGALAIGLGFGMQTVLKNFVSGLILLFERPFRVGDVLDVGGQKGTVTSIGLRASVLQLWDGTETLIPNSSLLENNVTNWTYTDRKVRFTVNVGAAYGSDPRRIIQVLNEVAERHGLVEKEPKPQVLFTDFADSTLVFELRFWVDVARVNAAQVSSDLRLMISGAFAENAIVIAFPQRDLHFDTARPLSVEIVPPQDKRPPAVPVRKPDGLQP